MRRSASLRFAYRLAREVGHTVDVHGMLRSMSLREFVMWQAYYELEPSTDQRIDWLVASVVAMIHNVKVPKQYRKSVEHFLLKFEAKPTVTQQTPEMQRALFLMYLGQGE